MEKSLSNKTTAPTLVLFEPEIPQNAGNIARTCAATGCHLVLVEPLGFRLSERSIKRAGLDYWPHVSWEKITSLENYLEDQKRPFYFFSSKGQKRYTEIPFTENDIYIFGSESKGLPKQIHEKYAQQFYTLPQKDTVRCLNLSNVAAIIAYSSWEARDFTHQSYS
jgi:tRNA (cytidine/uridine-2'-O-)-methyltransferase